MPKLLLACNVVSYLPVNYKQMLFAGTMKKLRQHFREWTILKGLRQYASNLKELDSESFKSHGFDTQAYLKAITNLPHNIMSFYTRAYCSLVWNKVAAERIRRHGTCVVEGDMVMKEDKKEVRLNFARFSAHCNYLVEESFHSPKVVFLRYD